MKQKRVVITGVGAVTPLGNSFAKTWDGILAGRHEPGPVTIFDVGDLPCRFAYEVRDFVLDESLLLRDEIPSLNRAATFGVQATLEALAQSGIRKGTVDPLRTSVCLGVGMGCPDFSWFTQVYLQDRLADPSVKYHHKIFPSIVASTCARLIGAQGGTTTIHTACASSGQSLGEAFELIADGEADVVLTGGADSMINPYHMAGFCLLGALSTRNAHPELASRPFDVGRDGFVLGEGSCMLVFEELEHALARGVPILGEICGYGITESAYRITDLHPEGRGPIEAMQNALASANISAGEIRYLNAHGTSTQLNDRVEALAVHKVFGADAPVKVNSTKSMTGHLISAAGALEFAICMEALRTQTLPPSINIFEQDSLCEVRLTASQAEAANITYALSNSVGFGGSNTALIARHWRKDGAQ